METKTLTYLNSKPWYRAVKVLYFIFVGLCCVFAVGYIIAFIFFIDLEMALLWVIILKVLITPWVIFWAWLVSNIPKWIFYYIYLGSIKPQK